MNMVNWGVGRKIAPISQQWSTVVTWDMFESLEDLMKYRVGEGPTPPSSKSKMRMSIIQMDLGIKLYFNL